MVEQFLSTKWEAKKIEYPSQDASYFVRLFIFRKYFVFCEL